MPEIPDLKIFSSLDVIVVGDLMLDCYLKGAVERISPEAPVPVLNVNEESYGLGGAANVAINLSSLGVSVRLFGLIGDDADGRRLIGILEDENIGNVGIIKNSSAPTVKKTRLIAANQQIVRIDSEAAKPCSNELGLEMLERLSTAVKQNPPNGIIISDYLKGTITDFTSKEIVKLGRENGVFIAVDPKGGDFSKYRGVTLITPNKKEAETASGISISDDSSLQKAFDSIFTQTNAEIALITRGGEGISFAEHSGSFNSIGSKAREVFDVTGAGDTVVSTVVLGLLSEFGLESSVQIANRAAGLVVMRLGAARLTQAELTVELNDNLLGHSKKYLMSAELSNVIGARKDKGEKIVFTNGCFDLFHIGHLTLLNEAKRLGDVLIVGLNTDASARRLKGEQRPLIKQNERANLLAALECVDHVTLFEEDTPLELIKLLKPDVLVKGGDYSLDEIVGREFVESLGGRVVILPLVEGISTTELIDKIRQRKS